VESLGICLNIALAALSVSLSINSAARQLRRIANAIERANGAEAAASPDIEE
jgi:hypothetical protein